mgnify:CR=1 FL=1
MVGRHLAGPRSRTSAADYPAGIPNGGDSGHGRRERLAGPGARISDDTTVTVDMEGALVRPEVEPSPAHPEALVENGRVGDGTELE